MNIYLPALWVGFTFPTFVFTKSARQHHEAVTHTTHGPKLERMSLKLSNYTDSTTPITPQVKKREQVYTMLYLKELNKSVSIHTFTQ